MSYMNTWSSHWWSCLLNCAQKRGKKIRLNNWKTEINDQKQSDKVMWNYLQKYKKFAS